MVAPATLRRLTEAVDALERRVAPPRQHVLYRYADTSDDDWERQMAERRASGEIRPDDDVMIIQWMTIYEAKDGRPIADH